MRKLSIWLLAGLILMSVGSVAGAKELKVGLDAGPVSQDPQVQLSGGMLQYSHWVFDPLVRYAQDMSFEPRLAERWERIDDLTMRFYLRKGRQVPQRQPIYRRRCKIHLRALLQQPGLQGALQPF